MDDIVNVLEISERIKARLPNCEAVTFILLGDIFMLRIDWYGNGNEKLHATNQWTPEQIKYLKAVGDGITDSIVNKMEQSYILWEVGEE